MTPAELELEQVLAKQLELHVTKELEQLSDTGELELEQLKALANELRRLREAYLRLLAALAARNRGA